MPQKPSIGPLSIQWAILDDDRRMNAQLFEDAFYTGNGRPVEAAGESHGQVNRMDILRKKRPDANIIRPLLL